jgi:hypothetical protein
MSLEPQDKALRKVIKEEEDQSDQVKGMEVALA